MSNTSTKLSPLDQACCLVGRFFYYFARVEQKIDQALAELPENQRTAILLCRQDELSYEDIAEVLGCSISATKSLIHRGRETLKQKLKPYLRTGAWREPSK